MLKELTRVLRRCIIPVLVILAASVLLTACAATPQGRPAATATAGSPASLLVLVPTQEAAAPAPTATTRTLAATRQPAATSNLNATEAPSATALLQMRATERPAATATPKPRATKRPTATPTARPARRATATPDDGLPTIALSRLPREARETIRLIGQGGPFPYDKDGATFQNREGLLPKRPSGYYREYTVITPGSYDRGARRIVAGRGGELYYTADHYDSFKRVIP